MSMANRAGAQAGSGQAAFADPGNGELPINSADEVRAAWSTINRKENAVRYDDYEWEMIRDRIREAAGRLNVELDEG